MYIPEEGRSKRKMMFEENSYDLFGMKWRWQKLKRGRISDIGKIQIGLNTFAYYHWF